MLIRVPDYFENFKCLAGACPHSCCIGWEVVLDEDSVALYKGVEGSLGEKLRAAMTVDAEGDVCFPLNGGRCPFLDGENLCEIHRQLGQEATSVTCREHPRFTEDFGAFREITLCASCPAARDLLLASREPLTFVEQETEEEAEEADEWLEVLLPMREELMAVLADRGESVHARLGEFLRLAEEQQAWLDEEEGETPCGGEVCLPAEAMETLAQLEILEADWRDVLKQAAETEPTAQDETLLERIAVYFAFRYLLKAVNDGDLLNRARFVAFSVLVVERLAGVLGLGEALRRYSCELEHSDENMERLLECLADGHLCMLVPVND